MRLRAPLHNKVNGFFASHKRLGALGLKLWQYADLSTAICSEFGHEIDLEKIEIGAPSTTNLADASAPVDGVLERPLKFQGDEFNV